MGQVQLLGGKRLLGCRDCDSTGNWGLFCPGAQRLRQPPTTARGVHQGDGCGEQGLAGLLDAELVRSGGHGAVWVSVGWGRLYYFLTQG